MNSAADRIANTIGSLKAEKDVGCSEGKEDRNSDLCAQWKAADAATNAAYATWATLLLSIVGTGLIFYTFKETRLIGRRSLRAYVSARPNQLSVDAVRRKMKISMILRNDGETPAYDVAHFGALIAATHDFAKNLVEGYDAKSPSAELPYMVLQKGAETGGEIAPELEFPETTLADLNSGELVLYIYGAVTYRDIFDRRHTTRFCLYADHFVWPKYPNRPKRSLRWMTADFGNGAT